jgi:hypothetical protein
MQEIKSFEANSLFFTHLVNYKLNPTKLVLISLCTLVVIGFEDIFLTKSLGIFIINTNSKNNYELSIRLKHTIQHLTFVTNKYSCF